MRIAKLSSLVSMLFVLLLVSFAAKAQGGFELPDSLPTTKEGFVKTEKDLIAAAKWLESTPIGISNLVQQRTNVNAWVVAWLTNSPTINVEARSSILKLFDKNPQLMIVWMADYTNDDITKPSQGKKYHAKVTLMDGQKVKGILKLIGDDRIQLLERKIIGKVRNGVNKVPDTLHYRNIETIKIRNTGLGIIGFVGGTVVGVIVGAVIGYFAPNDDTYDYDDGLRILTGFLGGGIGGVAGGIGGSKLGSRSFEIGGEYYNFQDFRIRMKKKGMEVE